MHIFPKTLAHIIFFVYLCSAKSFESNATPEFVYYCRSERRRQNTRNVERINIQNMSEGELESKVNEGLQLTHRRLVEQHRRDNQPLIFCENGQVKYVDPFTVAL